MFYGESAPDAVFQIPAYQYGGQTLLEPFRSWLSGAWFWRACCVPRSELAAVPALGQIEDHVLVPEGSWLVALSGASTAAAGFRYLVSGLSDRPVSLAAGAMATTDADPVAHVLPEPALITGPLRVIVANLAAAAADMQLLLHFAVPKAEGK